MIVEPIQHKDGTFSLSDEQKAFLSLRGYTPTQIYSALLELYQRSQQSEVRAAAEANLQPCGSCGSVDFIPTGNCHACATCGESQGCS